MANDVTNLPQVYGQTRCSPARFLARRRLLHDGGRSLGVPLTTMRMKRKAAAEGKLTSASRCAPTAAAHGGSHQPEHGSRLPSPGLLESKTSVRRKARLLAATSSDDANPANAEGKECVKSVNSSSKYDEGIECCIVLGESRVTNFSRGWHPLCSGHSSRSEEVRLPIWSKYLPNTTSSALLPSVWQDKLPSCNSRSLRRPRMYLLAEVSSRALMRGMRDAVATASREPTRQDLAQRREAQVLPPKEFAAARFGDIVHVQSH